MRCYITEAKRCLFANTRKLLYSSRHNYTGMNFTYITYLLGKYDPLAVLGPSARVACAWGALAQATCGSTSAGWRPPHCSPLRVRPCARSESTRFLAKCRLITRKWNRNSDFNNVLDTAKERWSKICTWSLSGCSMHSVKPSKQVNYNYSRCKHLPDCNLTVLFLYLWYCRRCIDALVSVTEWHSMCNYLPDCTWTALVLCRWYCWRCMWPRMAACSSTAACWRRSLSEHTAPTHQEAARTWCTNRMGESH